MRIVIQRVKRASVSIEGRIESAIQQGMMLLLGVGYADTQEDIAWLVKKTVNLRIFDDEQGVMNRSIQDIQGEMLVVSQFTLFASYKKGNRPSWIRAAKHDSHPALPALLRRTVAPVGPKSANRHVWCRYESGAHQRRSRNDLHG